MPGALIRVLGLAGRGSPGGSSTNCGLVGTATVGFAPNTLCVKVSVGPVPCAWDCMGAADSVTPVTVAADTVDGSVTFLTAAKLKFCLLGSLVAK